MMSSGPSPSYEDLAAQLNAEIAAHAETRREFQRREGEILTIANGDRLHADASENAHLAADYRDTLKRIAANAKVERDETRARLAAALALLRDVYDAVQRDNSSNPVSAEEADVLTARLRAFLAGEGA